MQDRLKLPLSFDPARLQADLHTLETNDWIDHFVPQNYEGVWSVLPLRGPAEAEHPIRMIYSDPTCTEFAGTPFLEGCPYFQRVLESFRCPLKSVRLMKLTAGSVIKEHTDLDLSFEGGTVRIHVPVATSPQVEFLLNGQRIDMEAGECWYLRLSDPHSVVNHGSRDRVHMVIDAQVDDWLRDVFAKAESE